MADLLLQSPLKAEPKKQNRWLLRFPTDVGIQTWACKSVAAPKMNITKNEMKFLNTSTYVNGSYTWQQMAITVRDFIAPSTSQGLIEWVRLHAESVTGRMGYNVGSSKSLTLELLDPTGVKISEWLCQNCILVEDIDFGGSLDYANDDVLELSFTIQPQYCILLY
jgi:hypothetical protein